MRHRGFPPTDDKGRARSDRASKSWTAIAERLRCPACDRKNALGQKVEIERGLTVRRCRYCQRERVIDIRKYLSGANHG